MTSSVETDRRLSSRRDLLRRGGVLAPQLGAYVCAHLSLPRRQLHAHILGDFYFT